MACCPFHDDKHPSMRLTAGSTASAVRRTGDVIDFTARLFGLNKKEAALKLAEDFSVSFDAKGHGPAPQGGRSNGKSARNCANRQGAEQKFPGAVRDSCICVERWEKEYAPTDAGGNMEPAVVEALQKKPYTEYLLGFSFVGSIGGTGPAWSLNTEKR